MSNELDNLYRWAGKEEKFSMVSFWIVGAASLTPLAFKQAWVVDVCGVIFILSSIAYSLSTALSNYSTIPQCEETRRKEFFSNSLNTPIAETEAREDYFNNSDIDPSLMRLAFNLYESTFFTCRNLDRTKRSERIKRGIVVTLALSAVTLRETNFELAMYTLQVVFIGSVATSHASLEFTSAKVSEVKKQLRHLLVECLAHGQDVDSSRHSKAVVLNLLCQYEAALYRYATLLDSKLFQKHRIKDTEDYARDKKAILGLQK